MGESGRTFYFFATQPMALMGGIYEHELTEFFMW